MAFSNPITGGQGALIRPAIKSPNFVAGTTGWIIRRDGSAEFNDVVIRGELESSNYVPGVSGWHLDPSGSAEFYDIVARGDIIAESLFTGTSAPRIMIWEDPGVGPVIEFETEDPDEISSGVLLMAIESGVGPPFIQMRPPRVLAGPSGAPPQLDMTSPSSDGSFAGSVLWSSGGTAPRFTLLGDFCLRLANENDVSVSSTNHAFQIGADFNPNLAMDGNEIMARDNGAAATLNLQNNGGVVNIGGDLSVQGAFSCNVIAVGQAAITPVANVISSVAVTGLGLESGKAYRCVATGNSSVPGEAGVAGALYAVSANNATDTGVTLYILRNNTTQTFVYYIVAADDI